MKTNRVLYFVWLILICPIHILADNYIIINQVMYDTPLTEQGNQQNAYNGEFIELYNAGISTVYLSGWRLTGDGSSEVWNFTSQDSILAGQYFVLACRRGQNNTFQLSDLYHQLVNTNQTIRYQNKIILANSGETLTLCNAQNDTVDQMHYDGTGPASSSHPLVAYNRDSLSGDSCVSLHCTWVEFDAEGKVISGSSQWETTTVSFGVSMLPYPTYYENYILGNQTLPAGENYVVTITPRDPVARIDMHNGQPAVCGELQVTTGIQYIDGIGRSKESIAIGMTPGNNDWVTTVDYLGKRKIVRKWLPVAMKTDGQMVDLDELKTQARTDYADSRPFSEVHYENSAQHRPLSQTSPGSTYEGHSQTTIYSFNSSNDQVRIYKVSSDSSLQTSGSYYDAATLYKTISADEDGKAVAVYTDKQGRKIAEDHHTNRTYYAYDDLGRLRFVLPNLPSSKLANGNYSINNSTLKSVAYSYIYDNRGNMIYKRLPGCEPQLMVYDKLGKLVLRQDGNQRAADKWTMCTYDSLGRNLSTTEITASQSHAQLISAFADTCYVAQYGSNPRPLTVSYYDNYDFLNALTNDLSFVQNSGYDQPYENATGLLTGNRVYNLSENGYTVTALYYDAKGRIVQNRSTNHNGGITTGSVAYLFNGSIAQQSIVQSMDTVSINEHYRYAYDHAGRAKTSHYQLNNDAEIKISEFSYDSIGRLVQFLLHENSDTIKYAYDMRNMLTETRNKHFSERLYYVDSLPQTATACYNGNIAAARIAQQDTAYTFTYQYDQLNRLTSSNRLTEYGSMFSEQFTYDPAGNILSLKRFNDYRKIDDLNYSYGNEGNQLLSVIDNGQDADQYEVIEYHNAPVQADTTMRYDANGNIIYDADREISAIHYNILNLPDTIQFVNGGQIVNFYDAVGRKYKSITYTNIASVIPQQYDFAHYSFETDSIDYLVTEYSGNIETRYSRMDTTMRIHNAIGYYTDSTYYHFIKDHLGNVCAVVNSAADTAIQSTLYYASGVPMAQSANRDEQPYLYNGKEFIEAHGLSTYDYGFRGYYATIGRFTSIDPLAEQTPWQSPYAYAGNNIINNIDWMGLSSGAFTTSDPELISDLLNYLSAGGSLNEYNPDGWEDITDNIEDYVRRNKDLFPIYDDLSFSFSLPGNGSDIAEVFVIASQKTNNISQQQLFSDLSKIGQEALKMASTASSTWGAAQWNPFYWIGANKKVYSQRLRYKQGGYAYSFQQAGLRLSNSPIGKMGAILGVLNIGMIGNNMVQNGISVGNSLDFAMTIAGFCGPWGLFISATYGAIDMGVTFTTGNSVSEWTNIGVNYVIDEYFQ